jgi:hypothetical protein
MLFTQHKISVLEPPKHSTVKVRLANQQREAILLLRHVYHTTLGGLMHELSTRIQPL